MRVLYLFCLIGLACMPRTSFADVPKVVTDIAPVGALVAAVMDGVGEPRVLLGPESSTHSSALRPSQARALSDADLFIGLGPALTPWLDDAIAGLQGKIRRIDLLDVEGAHLHTMRTPDDFALAFGSDEGEHDDGHDDAHEDGHDDTHDHTGVDPHAWLDTQNAITWLEVIAQEIAAIDPMNADTYLQNAAGMARHITDLDAEISELLIGEPHPSFVVAHDAFGYFEARYRTSAIGALSASDASDPSPAHVSALRGEIKYHDVQCILVEVGAGPRAYAAISDASSAQVVHVDPLGHGIAFGPNLYLTLLADLAKAIDGCRPGQ